MLEAGNAVREYFGECDRGVIDVESTEVVKLNDVRLYGLKLISEGANAGWTVYIDDLYRRYEEGEPLELLMDIAVSRCEESLMMEMPVVPHALKVDFETIRDRLTVRLLGIRNNMSYLAGKPYIDAGCGLALIAVINCEPGVMSEWVLVATDDLLRTEIRCGREELLTAALENTAAIEPPLLVRLSDYVYLNYLNAHYEKYAGSQTFTNYMENPEAYSRTDEGALMLTNASAYFGSAALFYPGVQERIAEILGCGYYVLPSSVHEVMIIPDELSPGIREMKSTVLEANRYVVDREEQLSDDIYHYDPEKSSLSIVRSHMPEIAMERPHMGKSIA